MAVDVIALDFYDGATEGFVKSISRYGLCYFKLIAWDDTQDERLYAAISVAQNEYDELVSILKSSEPMPASSVWVPKWEFESDRAKNRADKIIDTIQNRLRLSGLLVLGVAVADSAAKIREFDEVVGQHVGKYLEVNSPDNLVDWSKYFE